MLGDDVSFVAAVGFKIGVEGGQQVGIAGAGEVGGNDAAQGTSCRLSVRFRGCSGSDAAVR